MSRKTVSRPKPQVPFNSRMDVDVKAAIVRRSTRDDITIVKMTDIAFRQYLGLPVKDDAK